MMSQSKSGAVYDDDDSVWYMPHIFLSFRRQVRDAGLVESSIPRSPSLETPKPPAGFGIYDRKGTRWLIIRGETYLRIRSVNRRTALCWVRTSDGMD